MKIKDTKTALSLFKEAAFSHSKATEEGNYKVANKNYDLFDKAAKYLKENAALVELLPLLTDKDVGIHMTAASYLILDKKYEKEAKAILEKVKNKNNIHSLTAETILDEWKKGNLS